MLSSVKEEKLVELLQALAAKYNRQCSLRYDQLLACGSESGSEVSAEAKHGSRRVLNAVVEVGSHLRGLFATPRLGLSTGLLWLSWTLIGLAYPLFFIFLP